MSRHDRDQEIKELTSRMDWVEGTARAALQLAAANAERIGHMAVTLQQVKQQYDALLQRVDDYTTEIGGDLRTVAGMLQSFADRLARGELVTADELLPLVDALGTRADALQATAASATAIVPPPPPPLPTPTPTPSSSASDVGSVSASASSSSGDVVSVSSSDVGSVSFSDVGSVSGSVSGSSSLPAGLAAVSGFVVVAATTMPVYTFDGQPADVDPTTFPGVVDADGAPVTLNGKALYTFAGDSPGVLPPKGDGGAGGVWHAVTA